MNNGTTLTEEQKKELTITLLCKQLEDRCPPDKDCITSEFDGTCRDCWVQWCEEQYAEK